MIKRARTGRPWLVLSTLVLAAALATAEASAQPVAEESTETEEAGEEEREDRFDELSEGDQPTPPGAVQEIVVTITKRAQNVQDIAGSVTGFGATQIQQANIQNAGDLVSLIPNATVKGQGGPISIRGVSQSFTSQSPIANHINGVFVFDVGLINAMFYDLQGIDVARGPSGTVYGRNATSGALNMVWKRPSDQFEVFGDYTHGNYERNDVRGGINIPLFGNGDDRAMARFAFQRLDHDAYLDNLERDDPGREPGAVDLWHVRGSLEVNPHEQFRTELRGFWTQNKCCAAASKPWTPYPPTGFLDVGPGIVNMPYAAALPQPENVRELRSRAFEISNGGGTWAGFDGQFTYDLLDTPEWMGEVELALLGGFQLGDQDLMSDADGSELFILDTLRAEDTRNGTVELRAVSNGAKWVNWIAGIFYFNHELNRDQLTRSTAGILPPFSPLNVEATRKITNSGVAPYFSVEITPPDLDWLEVFGGFRWNQDEFKIDAVDFAALIRPRAEVKDSRSFSEPTGEFGVRGNWGDGNLLYAKYSRGYKAGTIEVVDGVANEVEPELIDAIEAGTKNRFFDNTLLLNLTGFWYGYNDLQVPTIQGLQIVTKNAAEATIWGLELESTWVPIDNWNITATASYLNATFNDFCTNDAAQFRATDECPRPSGSPPPTGFDGTLNLKGNRLEDSPEWKITLLTSYDWDLGRWGTITPVLKFTWSDQYWLRPFNCGDCVSDLPSGAFDQSGIDFQPGFSSTDIRLQWRSEGGTFWGEGFIENIEDNSVYSRVIVGSQFNGGQASRFGFQTPRIYGFRIGVNWEGL